MSDNPVKSAFGDDSCIRAQTVAQLAQENRLYVVFIIARSGSTWLTEQAKFSGVLGTPQEWLNESFVHADAPELGCSPPKCVGLYDVNAYLLSTAREYRSADGVMGIQLSRWQTQWVCEMLESPLDVWRHFVPFYLRRVNLVAQAISLLRSVQSGVFHGYQLKTHSDAEKYHRTHYDADEIKRWSEYLVENEMWFEQLFLERSIAPHRFLYEDLVENMPSFMAWMRTVIVGSKPEEAIACRDGAIRVMRDSRNGEWEERFRMEQPGFLDQLAKRRPAF